MKYTWQEEWYDNVLYVFLLAGLLIFFLCHFGREYRIRFAELVINNFLESVSVEGRIEREIYSELTNRILQINPGYDLNTYTVGYVLQPVYDYVPEEKIMDYFMTRNVKREKELLEWQHDVDNAAADLLCFQTETNASILASGQNANLPLPGNSQAETVEAVRSVQEVYEGEELITLCLISSDGGFYYAQAEPLQATVSGAVKLRLILNDAEYDVPVTVLCHPRYVVCGKGHKLVNSKDIINETKKIGEIACPYCAQIPEKITCSTIFVKKKTGEDLTEEDIFLTVTYMNGKSQVITPSSEEWQDTYDELYCGLQTVQVSYRGVVKTVTVLAENDTCKKCGRDCNERNRNDYEIFPYCKYCMSRTILFTGEVYEEELHTKINEMVLSEDGEGIVLNKGDYLVVQLSENDRIVSLMQKEILQDGQGEYSK